MRVALVHDWMTNFAGAERVLVSLHELFPQAPIYTSVYSPEEFPQLAEADVRTSFLQRVPFAKSYHQAFPLLRTVAFENFDLSEYDVVISSSHAEGKGVITRPETLHICYCYTPIRYYWSGYYHYLNNPRYGFLNPVIKLALPYLTNYLRLWDRCAADRVDTFVAISNHVARRIKKYYRRDARVIYPPVNTSWLKISSTIGDYFLLVGRLIPYKRADIVVEAFSKLGLPLKVVGTGSELEALKDKAGPNIEFLGRVPDRELGELYSRCLALVFPQEEDFGIVPLEAMAAGRPVIAYRGGGALETVVERRTGVFFDRQDAESLAGAVRDFHPELYDPQELRDHSAFFDTRVFKERIYELVNTAWKDFCEGSQAPSSKGPLSSIPALTRKVEGNYGTADKERAV